MKSICGAERTTEQYTWYRDDTELYMWYIVETRKTSSKTTKDEFLVSYLKNKNSTLSKQYINRSTSIQMITPVST